MPSLFTDTLVLFVVVVVTNALMIAILIRKYGRISSSNLFLASGSINGGVALILYGAMVEMGLHTTSTLVRIVSLAGLSYLILLGFVASRFVESKLRVMEKSTSSAQHLLARLQGYAVSMDAISQELAEVLDEQAKLVRLRSNQLQSLDQQAVELERRIAMLTEVQMPAVEYFIEATEKEGTRSARRDYLLFVLGLIISVAIAILLS